VQTSAPSLARLTRPQLAELFGVHEITITKWQREGMPIEVRGGPGKAALYHAPTVMAWWRARELGRLGGSGGPVSLEVERARLARVQTQKAELDLQAREGQLASVAEIGRTWTAITAAIRTRLLALPRALAERAAQAAQERGATGVERVVHEAVREALTELAAWTPPPAPAAAVQRA
jgi:phage terminase Nu1 subunit (DNA packaging protein)